jgi:hypothetical protein
VTGASRVATTTPAWVKLTETAGGKVRTEGSTSMVPEIVKVAPCD